MCTLATPEEDFISNVPSCSSGHLISRRGVVTAANPALVLDRLLVGVVVDHQGLILALVYNLLSLPEFFKLQERSST